VLGARRAREDNAFLCVPLEQALLRRLINTALTAHDGKRRLMAPETPAKLRAAQTKFVY